MEKRKQTIHELWIEFSNKFVRRDETPSNRNMLRRTFYVGALALMSLLEANTDDSDEPTIAEEIFMERLHEEMNQFLEDVDEGKM